MLVDPIVLGGADRTGLALPRQVAPEQRSSNAAYCSIKAE
jgi:hypothetical protein